MDYLQFVSSITASLAWPIAAVTIVCIFKTGILQRLPGLSRLTLPGGLSAEFTRELAIVEAVATDEVVGAIDDTARENRHRTEKDGIAGQAVETVAADAVQPEARVSRDLNASSLTYPTASQGATDGACEESKTAYETNDVTDPLTLLLDPGIFGTTSDTAALQANPTGVVMESWKTLESALRELAAKNMPKDARLSRKLGILQLLAVLDRSGTVTVGEMKVLRRMLAMRNLAAHADQPIGGDSARRFQEIAESLANTYRSK